MFLRIDMYPSALTNAPFTVEVSVRDSTGALMNVSNQVSLTLSTNPTKAILQGTTTRTTVSGVARFTDLVIATVGNGYQLTASSTAIDTSPGTSIFFNVTWSDDYRPTSATSPNNTPASAQPISPNVPMFGPLGPGELHYYKFRAKAKQLLSVSSYANRLDSANWDTSLRLRLIAPDGVTEIARSGSRDPDWYSSVDNGLLLLRIPSEGDYYLACDADWRGFLSGKYAVVMTLPEPAVLLQDEIEPWGVTGRNDTIATAEALQPGLLYGHHDIPATNVTTSDFYKISIPNPSRIRIELTAARNGAAYGDIPWDPRLELQDSLGAVLYFNDNTYFGDPAIDYIVTTPGTYYVRVTRPNPWNTGSGPYFLSYQSLQYLPLTATAGNTTAAAAMPIQYGADVKGSFSAAGDQYFSFGGTAGDVVRLAVGDKTQLQGATLTLDPTAFSNAVLLASDGITELSSGVGYGDWTENRFNFRQTILQATGTYFVRVSTTVIGSYGIRVERVGVSAREIEPNNTLAQANRIDASGWISGAIGVPGDIDHFLVNAEAGQLVTVSLLTSKGEGEGPAVADWGSALVPNLEVRDLRGTLLSLTSADRKGESNFAESTQRPDPMIETSFRAPIAADYDIVVTDVDGQGGATYFYALHVWKNQ
jgi:hypothetical protein